ncbi:ependymin-related protein 1-like [Ptychodera flava]|uniref:ependymin-related protein 1-like n=1 Tax=Ptychodera flava TaxID=63121 RepID=UPI00396A221A
MNTIILLLSSVVYASAYICCPPTKWEGQFGELGGYVTDKTKESGVFTVAATAHIDSDIQKVAMETARQVKIIQDYKKKIMYTIAGGNCTKTALQGTVEDDVCIPDRAKYFTTLTYFGEDLIADDYIYDIVLHGMKLTTISLVTRSSCIPMGLQGKVEAKDVKAIYSGGFFNVTLGIEDPSVFDVPAICQHAIAAKESGDSLVGSQFMEALTSDLDFKQRKSN